MTKISAGLLMYRFKNKILEVFLVHPGGPFFKNNDKVWGIPKGEQHDEEDLLETAKREFEEETGIRFARGPLTNLGFVKYNNKIVYCWAFESDLPENFVFKSNLSKFKWLENDKGEFFSIEEAKNKILPGQKIFLDRLSTLS